MRVIDPLNKVHTVSVTPMARHSVFRWRPSHTCVLCQVDKKRGS